MGEHQDKLNEYWDEFDKLTREKQLNYIWDSWKELISEVVREWEPETLEESIQELKEMHKGWKWEAVYENGGKPWSDRYETDEALEIGLTDFYNDFVKDKEDEGCCNVYVYNSKGEDFSESQFITEMISEIMGDE